MSNLIRWLEFASLGDHRGSLVAIEENGIVPFNIKRVYYMFNTIKGVTRGKHAHLQLKQVPVQFLNQRYSFVKTSLMLLLMQERRILM